MPIKLSPRPVVCVLLVLAFSPLSGCNSDRGRGLPALHVDDSRVAVAGLSSGAYMATQIQLAWPEIFSGVAMVAGGPYGCAQGKLPTALSTCMKGVPAPDIQALAARVEMRAHAGELGPLSALSAARVFALHGTRDRIVAGSVSRGSAALYEALRDSDPALKSMQVSWDGNRPFAHNLPVAAHGDDCGKSEAPYLGHCGFDAAGEIFAALFGNPLHAASKARGELRRFDQNRFRPHGKDAYLADSGYVYLPPDCAAGKSCGLLVALHGCKQDVSAVGTAFVRDAGFNRWADAYDVAVLYPQTRASFAPLNPQACWDWWGYSGADYDTRNGVQQQWLMNVLAALGLPKP